MAVALDDLIVYVTGKQPAELKPGESAALVDLHGWAVATVDRYLAGSTVPDAIRASAVKRVAYYDYHTRLSRRPADGGMLDARFRRDAPIGPLRASGAMSLLTMWKRRGVGIGDGRPIAERSTEIDAAVARALAARPGLSAADVATQIAAAIAALPPAGLTDADVLAAVSTALAGRAVTLSQLVTWTGPASARASALRSTGIDIPTEAVLLIARLGPHVGTAYWSAAMLAAIPRNDGHGVSGGSGYLVVSLGANRGLYVAKSARNRLKVGATHAGAITLTLYRLVLGAAA